MHLMLIRIGRGHRLSDGTNQWQVRPPSCRHSPTPRGPPPRRDKRRTPVQLPSSTSRQHPSWAPPWPDPPRRAPHARLDAPPHARLDAPPRSASTPRRHGASLRRSACHSRGRRHSALAGTASPQLERASSRVAWCHCHIPGRSPAPRATCRRPGRRGSAHSPPACRPPRRGGTSCTRRGTRRGAPPASPTAARPAARAVSRGHASEARSTPRARAGALRRRAGAVAARSAGRVWRVACVCRAPARAARARARTCRGSSGSETAHRGGRVTPELTRARRARA